jgi:hypothetical protein
MAIEDQGQVLVRRLYEATSEQFVWHATVKV